MKRILYILSLLLFFQHGFAQLSPNPKVVPRAGQANTPNDARLLVTYNLVVPKYQDTTTANIVGAIGIDSCGAVIMTYDANILWMRACNPKRWTRVQGQTVLPDGVYSGGDVGYTGTNLDFFETAAIYVLNGIAITSPTVSPLTLVASDPTFNRIDLIGLGPTGPVVITGTPAASPQEPSFNPQVFIRRAAVLVEAGAVTPTIITNVIYDENLGLPDEWIASNVGGTVDFDNTNFPYHLTKDASVTAFDSSDRLKFNLNDTVSSGYKGSIVGFIRLASTLPDNQNFLIQLFSEGLPVSTQLQFTGYGMFRNIIGQYQPFVFPFPAFGAANILFDEIRIIPVGGGAFPLFKIDFIQFQTGFTPTVTGRDFAVVDNFAYSDRTFNSNAKRWLFNNNYKYILNSTTPSDTAFAVRINGTDFLRFSSATGTLFTYQFLAANGNFSVNAVATVVNNASKFVFAGSSYLQTELAPLRMIRSYPLWDGINTTYGFSVENDTLSGNVYPFADSATQYIPLAIKFRNHNNYISDKVRFWGDGKIWATYFPDGTGSDSILVSKNGYISTIPSSGLLSGGANSNIGSGYRWAVPNTKNIKTTFVTNGVLIDSSSNTNALTLQVDSLAYTTRGRSQKLADSVSAIIASAGTNANIGTGYRWAVFGTRNIKSIIAGANITIDSSVSGSLTIASSAGSPGTLTSFGFTNGSGFTGNVTNSTTTPTLALTTSLTTGRVPYIGASGALSETANLVWDNTNQRFNIGGAAATAYLGLAASTTAQASLNLGNAGTAPTSPNNADVWVASNHIMARLGGTTYQIDQQPQSLTINSTAIASGTAGRVLFQNASNQVSQNANFFWDNVNNRLQLNGATVAAALALPASTTTQAPLNLGNGGTAPTSPNNADVWVAGNHILVRLNGVTTQLDAQSSAGVTSITGTANQVIASASTGAVTLSLPQSIATTSNVTFQRATLTGAAATANAILSSHTDPAAAAGVLTNNGSRLAFSFATTYKRFALTNDVAPANGQIPIGNGTDYTVSAITPSNNTMVITNGAGSITVGLNMAFQTLTDGGTITWNAANGFNAIVTLGGTGRTLARSNWVAGGTYTLEIRQDATGSRTITTWPTGIRWQNSTPPTLPTTPNSIFVVSFLFDGTNVLGNYATGIYQ